jgi:hypothetical protein
MAEQSHEAAPREEQKPGYGVDRTLIRRLLAMTPGERVRMMIAESRNVTDLLQRIGRLR